MRAAGLVLLLLSALPPLITAVKRQDFKTCAQAGFCRRLRDLPVTTGSSPYSLDPKSIAFDSGSSTLSAAILSSIYPEAKFSLQLAVTKNGLARLKIDELAGLRQRYNETAQWVLVKEPELSTSTVYKKDKNGKGSTLSWETRGGHQQQARITYNPLKIDFLRDGTVHVAFNDQNLFHMEHFRVKNIGVDQQDPPTAVIDDGVVAARSQFEPFTSEDGAWEETFGSNTDSKPKGPESISFDVTFPGYEHVFGIPQHASPLSLRTTRGGDGAFTDPYRLYNADVFEYEADSEMSIYGSIPFMHAHKAGSTVAVFDVVASETWIDITKSSKSTHTHWMSESGILDLFVFLGPTTEDVFETYGQLTGTTALPQMFAIGHHQCRWNYLNQEDVAEVTRKFDEHDIPFDVIWLDIEYAKEHEYFIWDRAHFPKPEVMQDALAAVGRQLVAIVDPHIKRDDGLYVYKEAQSLGILSKQPDGVTEYEGWCWPGSSAWVDWLNPASWQWWTGLFKFDKFVGSRPNLYIWNDMNEPAIFSGPEISMPRDNVHYGGWEHRDVHNMFGMLYHNITSQALIAREQPAKRPFVLSRAFFAGSQRFGSIWTGDNMGTWDHLAGSVPMILGNSVAGMAFNGADVGGFFGNPEPDMLVRWYQSGAFYPFFRAHAHIDTKRREPYLFDEPIRGYLRDAIRLRYSLLPAWYTAFFHASLSGTPVIRPHYVAFPQDTNGFAVDDQFFVGTSGLLVHPVVRKDAEDASVYLADDEPYYDYHTHDVYMGGKGSSGSRISVPAPLSKLPLFHRGGSITTRRDLVRRAAPLMWRDPISLVIALDRSGSKAGGDIYMDDGSSYSYTTGQLIWRAFELSAAGDKIFLRSSDLVKKYDGLNEDFLAVAANYDRHNKFAQSIKTVMVDEITILGLKTQPSCIRSGSGQTGLAHTWNAGLASNAGKRKSGGRASILRIHAAGLPITEDWEIIIELDPSRRCSAAQALVQAVSLEDPTCPGPGQARCRNVGHISQCLLISRVNDGICDPECCDGSDETDGKVQCPNVCAQLAKEHKAKADAEARVQRVGAKLRKEWSIYGMKEKRKLEKSLAKRREETATLAQRERTLKIVLEKLEKSEASDIERKKSSTLYKRLEEHREALTSLRKQRTHLQSQIGDLQTLLSDLKTSFNPNYQDMAVLGAVRAFDDWRKKHAYEITEESPVGRGEADSAEGDTAVEEVQPATLDFDEISDEILLAMEGEDSLNLISELDATSIADDATSMLFRLEEYLPDSLRPHYEGMRKSLLDVLTNFGLISKTVVEKSERPDVSKARTTYQDAERSLRDNERQVSENEASLKKDWGADWAWKKLEGQCIEKEAGEYVYELCFFDKASQRSNKGHGTTNLGNFASWNTAASVGTPEYYLKQSYENGQRCWNGPDRSVAVEFICGTSNALLSIMEPEKCTYLYKVQTPGVCVEPAVQGSDEDSHSDEL